MGYAGCDPAKAWRVSGSVRGCWGVWVPASPRGGLYPAGMSLRRGMSESALLGMAGGVSLTGACAPAAGGCALCKGETRVCGGCRPAPTRAAAHAVPRGGGPGGGAGRGGRCPPAHAGPRLPLAQWWRRLWPSAARSGTPLRRREAGEREAGLGAAPGDRLPGQSRAGRDPAAARGRGGVAGGPGPCHSVPVGSCQCPPSMWAEGGTGLKSPRGAHRFSQAPPGASAGPAR